MNDSISRQAAIEAFEKRTSLTWESLKILHPMFEVLIELPSAQPELVRCGDCKYFKVEYGWNCASYPICEVSPQRIITPDDYCSFAERRTDDE